MSKRPPLVVTCFEKKTDCNRYLNGNCTILINTVFHKPCPFYKSVNEENSTEIPTAEEPPRNDE